MCSAFGALTWRLRQGTDAEVQKIARENLLSFVSLVTALCAFKLLDLGVLDSKDATLNFLRDILIVKVTPISAQLVSVPLGDRDPSRAQCYVACCVIDCATAVHVSQHPINTTTATTDFLSGWTTQSAPCGYS